MITTIEDVLKKFPKVEGKRTPLSTWIKRILSMEYPGTKFGAVTRGNAIDVRWVDGPSLMEVNKILAQFEAGHFDGMTDMYEYRENDTAWQKTFGSMNYIFVYRDTTVAQETLKNALLMNGVDDNHGFHSAAEVASRMLRELSIPVGFTIQGVERKPDVRAGMIEDFYTVTFSLIR